METHPFSGPHRLALALSSYAAATAQEGYLQAVLRYLPVIAFRVDPEGRIAESSGLARDALVARRGDSTGRLVSEAYADVPEVLDAIARARAGEAVEIEVCVAGRDYRVAYEPAPDGSVIGVALAVRPRREPLAGADTAREAAAIQEDAIGVITIEPHARLRAGLAAELGAGGLRVVAAAADAGSAMDALRTALSSESAVRVVVLCDGAGVEPLLRIRAAYPDVRVLVVAARAAPALVAWWHERGAHGVVDARAPGADVVDAVALVDRYGAYVADASHLRAASGAVLAPRERQVACLTARDLTREQIAAEMGITPGTVGVLASRARKRLGVRTDVGLALHAVREGWVPLGKLAGGEQGQ